MIGRARRFGDHVNSDYIIASRRKRETIDAAQLATYVFEAIDPTFASSVRPGDVVVAGRNFGCGSAMEVAVTVLLAAGIRVVIADSFARAFYRNAVNNGLTPIVLPTAAFHEGDALAIEMDAGDRGVVVRNQRTGATTRSAPLPPAMAAILSAGGLVAYVKRHGRLPS